MVLVLGLAAGVAARPRVARAQIPGESVFDSHRSLRDEYRALAYEEVRQAMMDWTESLNGRQLDRLKKSVSDAILFAPMGWAVVGHDAFADSMKTWLPRIGGFHFTMADFDASGNLAYAYGTVRYHLTGVGTNPGGTEISAEAVIVLYHLGSKWKVRSYLERPLAP